MSEPSQPTRRIVVAMSGGVDSSVVAAILKRAGHDVIGITLQLYDSGEASGRKGACCAGQDIQDARRVAETLGIPHYILDYESRFAKGVIAAFADSYIAGETPIPCVTCNQKIKFNDLLETAKELGADALATGHYIQRQNGPKGPELRRAADADRDQSYFLFATTRPQLDFLQFPIGHLSKAEVRELARQWHLPVADKADSQDICFVPKGRYSEVIERLKPGAMTAGDIVHADGRVLGRHEGIANFTIGQRRGLRIPDGDALYVLDLDAERNKVVVGPRDLLRTDGLMLKNVNWLGDDPLELAGTGMLVHVRIRSTGKTQPATLHADRDGQLRVLLENGEYGVARGQACVFYQDATPQSRVLGGGWIERTIQPATAGKCLPSSENTTAASSTAIGTKPVQSVRGASG